MKNAAILILGAFVVWLVLLCNAWRDRYDELQADYTQATKAHHEARRVDLRVLDRDVWLMIDSLYVYRFESACPGPIEKRTF